MRSEVECRYVRHPEIDIGLCCPTSALVKVGHLQFIDPHNAVTCRRRIVAHTYHHHPHIAQRRISEHRHAIGFLVGVPALKHLVVADSAVFASHRSISRLFQVNKLLQHEVKAIGLGPHLVTLTRRLP